MITFKMEGLEQTVSNLSELSKATSRNVIRRALRKNAEPVADLAARLAPHRSGRLAYSISVSSTLTRRHKGEKVSEVEVYIGPAGGLGALYYASFDEFGTIDTPAFAFMRTTWFNMQTRTFEGIRRDLAVEVEKSRLRAARKAARFAGGQ